MNNKECKLIQDLLPNYIEKLTSSESNEIIEEHLKECEKCQKNYKKMKIDFENKHEDNELEVNYAKKVKANLKILYFILIFIILIILVFLGNLVRKFYILNKLSKIENKYTNCNNYTITNISSYFGDGVEKTTTYFKDDIVLEIRTSASNNFIFNDIKYLNYKDKDFRFMSERKQLFNNNENKIYVDGKNIGDYDKISSSSIYINELLESEGMLKTSFLSKIKNEEFDGVSCYTVELYGQNYTFEKETGLLRKYSLRNTDFSTYYYEINSVNDKMIEKPDVTGYEYQDSLYTISGEE